MNGVRAAVFQILHIIAVMGQRDDSGSLACNKPVDVVRVHGKNIFAEFINGPSGPAQRWVKRDVASWGLDTRNLLSILKQSNPTFIVEVGSWKGLSAIFMGHWLKMHGRSECRALLCIDSWLGTTVAWRALEKHGNTLYRNSGYPSIYYQFLYNVMNSTLDDIIVPLPMPSNMGAIYVRDSKLSPDLVFIDACHDYPCVLADILAWYPLVRQGGTLFGDDVARLEVRKAVKDAATQLHGTFEIVGRYWRMIKR